MPAKEQHLTAEDSKVLSTRQWCALNGFSVATGKRILKSGDGPCIIQLSTNRIGIRVIDNVRWQEARLRG